MLNQSSLEIENKLQEKKKRSCNALVSSLFVRTNQIAHYPQVVGKNAELRDAINIHIQDAHHIPAHQFACPICPSSFRQRLGLKKHMNVKHSKTAKFQCPFCAKFMYNKNDLDGHVTCGNHSSQKSSTLHWTVPPHHSDYPTTFADHGQPVGHLPVTESVRKDLGFPCRACPDVFSNIEEYNYHMECTHRSYEHAQRCEALHLYKEEEGEKSSIRCSTSELLGKFAAYECSYCSVIVTDYLSLNQHSKNCPSPSCYMICLTCGEKFPSKSEMRQHLKFMHHHKTFGCRFCDMMFLSSSGLLSHTKAKHKPDPKTLCQICGQAFHNRANLQGHMNMHLGVKPFQCKKCGKSYGHSKSLMNHEKSCSKMLSSSGKVKSRWSNLAFTEKNNRFLHRNQYALKPTTSKNKNSSNVGISSVDQSFSFPEHYQSYDEKKIDCESRLQSVETTGQSYDFNKSTYQPLQSLDMGNLNNSSGLNDASLYDQASAHFVLPHMPCKFSPALFIFCHQQVVTMIQQGKAAQNETSHKEIICRHCNEIFQREDDLKHHQDRWCPYYQIPFFTLDTDDIKTSLSFQSMSCTLCMDVFKTNADRAQHMSLKHGVTLYQCEICHEHFGSTRLLWRHKKTIHGVASGHQSCPICGKQFTRVFNLRGHMNMHKGARPFKCSKCGQAFAYSQSQHRHQKLCNK
ncbi:hypothetical protein Btru_043712 [Bulinus truncatus]|nr:hypothetical protein Btru_043712 [Bulinus truncatus]